MNLVRCCGALLPLLAVCGCVPQASIPFAIVHEGYVASTDGTRLFVRVVGTGPDTVVTVHGGPGAGMNAIMPDLAPLAERHTVIYFDQRGGGRSDLPADTAQLSADRFVEDLEAVRRHFGLERMNVLAHSFGSIIVARYAERHPGRLSRMVFLGATGPRAAESTAHARAQYAMADSAALQQFFVPLLELVSGTAENPVASCQAYRSASRELAAARGEPSNTQGTECDMPLEALRYYFRYTARIGPEAFGDWDFTVGLEELAAPLLVIYGDRDPTALPMQRAWAAAVPEGRLFIVPYAGKGAHADRPDLVFPAIETFFQGIWPAGAVDAGNS